MRIFEGIYKGLMGELVGVYGINPATLSVKGYNRLSNAGGYPMAISHAVSPL